MTNDEKIRRGQRAAEILNDPLVEEALTAMRAFASDSWRESKLGQREERETLYFLNCAIEDFAKHFRSLVDEGKFAAKRNEEAEQERAAG